MLHTFYLADFTYTGTVNIKVASLGATALNIAPIAMTKREGGYSAEIDVPAGPIAVSYQSTDDPRTIDINEIVTVGNATAEIATAVDSQLSTQLTNIELLAKIASEPITNRTEIDAIQNRYTLFQDDGITPRVIKNLADENGDPSSTRVFSEVPQ